MAYHIDKSDNSLVIDGFEKGIADSPFEGISDMRNVNITSVPGEASVNFATTSLTLPSASGTVVSADSSTEKITISGGSVVADQAIVFSGGSLPGNIIAGTTYWVKALDSSTVFTISATPRGSTFNISSTGTGTFISTDMGKPVNRCMNKDSAGNVTYFIIDSNGRVWRFGGGESNFVFMGNTTLTNAHGNGVITYRGYLFAFRDAAVDYTNLSSISWTFGWSALSLNTAGGTPNSHQALVGQDDVVYYCDASYLGSFFQKVGQVFDPGNSATFTANSTALSLPSTDIAQCLAELGVNLLVGGQLNAIYPWNRTATSFTYPILLAENYISKMVTVNTNTYILAGNRGRVYITNGSQADVFKKIPDHICGTIEPYFNWGDLCSTRKQLYFGVSAKTNGGSVNNQYGGVWAIDLDTKAIRLTNQLSYGTYAGISSVLIPYYVTPSSTPAGSGLLVGWDSGASTFGMDTTSTSPYTGSQATIDSDLIPIGTFNKPMNFNTVEYKLTRPLVSGESIVIKTRAIFNTSDTGYTATLTDSTASNFSNTSPSNLSNAQWIQLQAVLNSTNSSPSYVRFKEMRIKQQ